ncbi:MAG: FAD-binding oxidoreductase [Rhodanobacter sp.]
METGLIPHGDLIATLREAVGSDAVIIDDAVRAVMAGDLYAEGPRPVAVIRPRTSTALAAAVAATTARGYSVVPRGDGLSYTGGYTCEPEHTVLVDLSALDRIVEISAQNMYVVAEAGVTWKQLYETLTPLGLRLPFFGTFSGAGATVGGGLSHGALFFGSARYGTVADNALGLEMVTADGTLLRTGQWALQKSPPPTFRNFGPDTTGLFLHDGGALGIKTKASLRLIRLPTANGYASYAFATFAAAGRALSAVARAGVAEEAYVLDPGAVAIQAERGNSFGTAWRAIRQVWSSTRGVSAGVKALLELARVGRAVIPEAAFTLHMVAAGACQATVLDDLACARQLALTEGGVAIAATVPRIARADPFPPLNAVLDASGSRWAALNVKVAHSQAQARIHEHQALVARHHQAMDDCGVRVTWLCSALGNHSFSFEAVFHWFDTWLPLHRQKADPVLLASFTRPLPNPVARALVATLREETCVLFRDNGGASSQIGRTHPFMEILDPAPAALLRGLKTQLDPRRHMNPGVLGL